MWSARPGPPAAGSAPLTATRPLPRRSQSGSAARRMVREAMSCDQLLTREATEAFLEGMRDEHSQHFCHNNKCSAFKARAPGVSPNPRPRRPLAFHPERP